MAKRNPDLSSTMIPPKPFCPSFWSALLNEPTGQPKAPKRLAPPAMKVMVFGTPANESAAWDGPGTRS
jgi:hypothetical protein